MKLLYIDTVGPNYFTKNLKKYLDRIRASDVEIDVTPLKRGPATIEFRYYSSLVVPDILHKVIEAEKMGYEGVIIGCFYDPGLYAAREVCGIPIVGAGESSTHLASLLGYKFSIIVGRTVLRLIPPTSGKVFFEDRNILDIGKESLRKLRREIQIVFQDPYWALNPRMIVKDIIGEPLETYLDLGRKEREERIIDLLRTVGLDEDHMMRYPHEFSGGQRQRICIARAIALNPKFLVLDEPTSALDVSVQSQILNLLRSLQKGLKLTYLFISHDLSIVQHLSDKIGVMYLGKIFEIGSGEEVFSNPLHPYTKALFNALPIPDPELRKDLLPLKGEVPSIFRPPKGCRFHTRCPEAKQLCMSEEPELRKIADGHLVA